MSTSGTRRAARSVDFPIGTAQLITIACPGSFQWRAGPDGTDNVFLGGGRVHALGIVLPGGATTMTVDIHDYRAQEGDPIKGGSAAVAPPEKHLLELLGANSRYPDAVSGDLNFESFAAVVAVPAALVPANRVARHVLTADVELEVVEAECPHGIVIVASADVTTTAGSINVVYSPYTVGAQHFRSSQKGPFTIPAGRQSAFSFSAPGI